MKVAAVEDFLQAHTGRVELITDAIGPIDDDAGNMFLAEDGLWTTIDEDGGRDRVFWIAMGDSRDGDVRRGGSGGMNGRAGRGGGLGDGRGESVGQVSEHQNRLQTALVTLVQAERDLMDEPSAELVAA